MPSPSSFPLGRLAALVLVVAIATLWLANMGHRALQHPDEGRYAEIAREMVTTGDWLTPRLNGLKYFEKPPLQYWLTAAAFEAFGIDEWTARLWPALGGLVAVLVIGWAGTRLGGPALGWSASLALAGTFWQVALSQIVTLDALLSCLLAIGFASFVVAQRDEASATERRNAMWVTWAAMAGATLTKGLIGLVLPGGTLAIYCLVTRDWRVLQRLHLGSGLLIFLVLAAPWFVAVSRANPEFASFFFVHEHFDRFLTPVHRRTGSAWYFVPYFIAGVLPWLGLIAVGAVRAWRDGRPNAAGFSWQRFALIWAAFVFVFFSASSSKLPSYILPMFPPLALVVGWLLLRYEPLVLARVTVPLALFTLGLAIATMAGYDQLALRFSEDAQMDARLRSFGPWVQCAFASAAVGACAAVWAFSRATEHGRWIGIAALSLSTLLTAQLVVAGLDSFRSTRSSYDILAAASAQLPDHELMSSPAVPFFQVKMYDQTIPFYLGRTTTVVAFQGELALGISAEPERAILHGADWLLQWEKLPQGFAVMEPDDYEELAKGALPMRLLARDPKRVIVSRR